MNSIAQALYNRIAEKAIVEDVDYRITGMDVLK